MIHTMQLLRWFDDVWSTAGTREGRAGVFIEEIDDHNGKSFFITYAANSTHRDQTGWSVCTTNAIVSHICKEQTTNSYVFFCWNACVERFYRSISARNRQIDLDGCTADSTEPDVVNSICTASSESQLELLPDLSSAQTKVVQVHVECVIKSSFKSHSTLR